MPTYDYECDACGHTFELFQTITESLKRKCPECGRMKLRRLIGAGAAIVFKGSGFYQTVTVSELVRNGISIISGRNSSKCINAIRFQVAWDR